MCTYSEHIRDLGNQGIDEGVKVQYYGRNFILSRLESIVR